MVLYLQAMPKMTLMKLLFSILFLLGAFVAQAQWYSYDKVGKKPIGFYTQAIEKAQDRDFKAAVPLLQKAIAEDARFVDAYLSLGGIYGEMKDYANSQLQYEKAFALDSAYTRPYRLPYAINCAGAGLFEKALAATNAFLTTPGLNETSIKSGEYRKKCWQFAIDYARNNPSPGYVFAPQNLGDSVNTSESEYFPSLTIDGKKLVFTRRLNNFNEDFFETSRLADNRWTKATSLPGDVNSNFNEGAQNIAQDGSILFFTGCNFPEGAGSCDLFYSVATTKGWSTPLPAGRNINTEFWESQPSLSADKKVLYFAARGPGSLGGSDIFMSRLDDKGRWTVPVNMGPAINTTGDESCPFIHADNQTFYFTSNGHQGYGSEDLFVSRRGADGKWGTPFNLGYPINTIQSEGSLVIASDGVTAYYASDRSDTRGGLDIYTFTLRKDLQPLKTLWVKGNVFDAKTKTGLPSTVELVDLGNGQTVSQVQTDEQGNYFTTLPVGKDYAFNVNRRGYLFYSANYSFSKNSPDTTYKLDIPLQPLQKDAMVVLKNIFFESNKTDLLPASVTELNKIVQLLTDNPTLRIEIGGHTDNVGNAKSNLALSNNRAKAVVSYLISKGVAATRLSAKGYGATRSVADNKTEAGKAQNRRTELKVLGV
jgi:outer membrane protein OmpA-like peptidoglycan-associated protein/tetratricopeptide (TPR) repeat protein